MHILGIFIYLCFIFDQICQRYVMSSWPEHGYIDDIKTYMQWDCPSDFPSKSLVDPEFLFPQQLWEIQNSHENPDFPTRAVMRYGLENLWNILVRSTLLTFRHICHIFATFLEVSVIGAQKHPPILILSGSLRLTFGKKINMSQNLATTTIAPFCVV